MVNTYNVYHEIASQNVDKALWCTSKFLFIRLPYIIIFLWLTYKFRFPIGEIYKKWVEFVHLCKPLFNQSKSAMVCENHFTENDYSLSFTSIKGRKTLNKNAVLSFLVSHVIQIYSVWLIIFIFIFIQTDKRVLLKFRH